MVRIPPDFGNLSLTEVIFITLGGWGIFALATGIFFLLKYQAGTLEQGEVLKWQRNWERRRGQRRPIADFSIVYFNGAKRIRFASYLLGGAVLFGLVFHSVILLGIIAWKAHHLLQDRGVVTGIWASAAVDFSVLLPSYLAAKLISRGLRSVGEKILKLAANRPDRDATGQGQEG